MALFALATSAAPLTTRLLNLSARLISIHPCAKVVNTGAVHELALGQLVYAAAAGTLLLVGCTARHQLDSDFLNADSHLPWLPWLMAACGVAFGTLMAAPFRIVGQIAGARDGEQVVAGNALCFESWFFGYFRREVRRGTEFCDSIATTACDHSCRPDVSSFGW